MITFVLGGARSGKTALAERLALGHDGRVLYLATGVATDEDMAARIDAHRAQRHPRFDTIEAGSGLAQALACAPSQAALVDSLGTWVAGHHDFAFDLPELLTALRLRTAPTVVVSDEVGLSVHAETALGCAFRDAVGTVNQAVAALADEAFLVVAGRVVPLAAPASLAWPDPS